MIDSVGNYYKNRKVGRTCIKRIPTLDRFTELNYKRGIITQDTEFKELNLNSVDPIHYFPLHLD
jgi:hypothetical protein